MRRLLQRLLVFLAVIAIAAVAAGYAALFGSLPIVDGVLPQTGIGDDVSIARDAAGIPTVTASSRVDLAFGLGYAHAQDRFFQMDLTRRRAAGELAALVGSVALPLDRRTRLHRFRRRAANEVSAMGVSDRAVLDAYTDGVNAGLSELRVRPFEYLLLRQAPIEWRPEDTLLVVFAMFLELNDDRASRDVQRGYVADVLAPEVFDWLYPEGTSWDAPVVGPAAPAVRIPGPDVLDLRTSVAARSTAVVDEEGISPGSNNWAVSGARTEHGRAMVADDMHLGIAVPNTFYRARLIQTDEAPRDVSGVTLPGTPVVVAGSNGRVAWGFTNSVGDWSDAVLVVPGESANSYRTPNGELSIEAHEEVIGVADGPPERRVVRETIWGPVDDSRDYPSGAIVVSWTAHRPGAINLRQMDLETAATAEAALDVANRMGIPPQNFVVGDDRGNIGWTIAGRIPNRGAAEAMLPADWSAGGGWSGWREPGDYPRVVNPAGGRLWTANTRVVDGEALRIIGNGGYFLGARGAQIRDRLFAKEQFSAPDMLAIQLDDRALFLDRWQALLVATLDDDAIRGETTRAEFRRLVDKWLPRAAPESVGFRLVRAFRREVRRRAFDMLTTPVRERFGPDVSLRVSNQFEAPLWQLVTARPSHLLSADYASWDAFLLAAVDAVANEYAERYDDGLRNRTWGERNTAAIRHPLSPAVPLLAGWLDMPAEPLAGAANMPRAQGPAFGASERFAVAPGDEANGILHMPAGQSGHPLSANYRTGHDDWVAGRPSPFLPGEAEHVLILRPAE